jgi:hypothetical protein
MPTRTISMFEDQRLTLEDSIDLTRQSLLAYGCCVSALGDCVQWRQG